MNTQDVIATLNALLQTTKDGALGFRSCAKLDFAHFKRRSRGFR
jgi:hypothetical protein